MQTVLTACSTPEAIEAFTKHVWVRGENAQKVLNELGGMCKFTFRVFEAGPPIKTFTDVMRGEKGMMDYSIISIAVQAEGTDIGNGLMLIQQKTETLYAMEYQQAGAEI